MGSIVGEVKEIITTSYSVWKVFEEAKDRLHDAYDVIQKSRAQFELYGPLVESNLDQKKAPLTYDRFTTMMKNFGTKVRKLIQLLKSYSAGLPGDKLFFMLAHLSELDEIVDSLNKYLEEFKGFIDDMQKVKQNEMSILKAEDDAKAKKQAASTEAKKKREEEKKRKREQALVMKFVLSKDRAELVKAAKNEKSDEWEKLERTLVDMDELITRADAKRILKPLREEIRKTAKDEIPKTQKSNKSDSSEPKTATTPKFGTWKPRPPIPSPSGSNSSVVKLDSDSKGSAQPLSVTFTPEKRSPSLSSPPPVSPRRNSSAPAENNKADLKVASQPDAVGSNPDKKASTLKPPKPSPSPSRASSPAGYQTTKPKKSDESPAIIPKPDKSPPKMKHCFRIACVDFTHGSRAAMAQCHLEHMRLLTANTTGHWLFDCVESAGAGIPSDFLNDAIAKNVVNFKDIAKVGDDPLNNRALTKFDASIGGHHSRETHAMIERMKLMKRQPITTKTLLSAKHIICFGEFTYKTLLKLKAHALSQASDMKPGEVDAKSQMTLLPVDFILDNVSDEILEKTLTNIKIQIDGFLVREFNWTQPTVEMWKGLYRSRQFCLPWNRKDILSTAKRGEICKKFDCKFIKEYYSASELECLVTVVGSKDSEKLLHAEQEIKAILTSD